MGMHLKTIFPNAHLAAFCRMVVCVGFNEEQNFDPSPSPYLSLSTSKSSLLNDILNFSQSLEICESDFVGQQLIGNAVNFPSMLFSPR